MAKKHFENFSYETARLEGGLFVRDILERAMVGEGSFQKSADYGIESGLFTDAAGSAWQDAKSYREIYARNKAKYADKSRAIRTYMNSLIGVVLDYGDIGAKQNIELAERGYSVYITEAASIPFLFADDGIDIPSETFAVRGGGRRKVSAFTHMQEFLNASGKYDWGIVADERTIRLLRDSSSLSRLAWLEFDIEKIFAEDRYPDFCALWRLLHASRAMENPCIWERWRDEGTETGARVKENLRIGVRGAIEALGSGFIKNRANTKLRTSLNSGELSESSFYSQLLRVVYRLIFLFTLEERGILQTAEATDEQREIYRDGYSMRRLRQRCLWPGETENERDLWTAAEIVTDGLAVGCPELALPALGGLFSRAETPDINDAMLDNASFLTAISNMRWSLINNKRTPVDYKNMDSEEMGSVYESLLEFIPRADIGNGTFRLEGLDNAGNERKKSGSYYTPSCLVSEIIESALTPVIDGRLKGATNAEAALLTISVLDPACGSGHFLVAAARKLAERLAAIRAGDSIPEPAQYRAAVRDVISHCIYGVDVNPMGLELCKTVLWLEGFDGSRPLSFLDAHLVCGDSLLGVIDMQTPLEGIPDEAYTPLTGDDKEFCKRLKATNKKAREEYARCPGQGNAFQENANNRYKEERRAAEAMADGTVEEIEAKAHVFAALTPPETAALLYMAAFLSPKNDISDAVPTSRDIYALISGGEPEHMRATSKFAKEICRAARVLNWPAKFPLVMENGGFDCVISNPPWEKIKLQEKEWFAQRVPIIASARNKAEREEMILLLASGRLTERYHEAALIPAVECQIFREYQIACHVAEAASLYVHTHGDGLPSRFQLTGRGDVNLYALFAETVLDVTAKEGRAGIIVPTGIATDDSTKAYFSKLIDEERIGKMLSFINQKVFFPDVHASYTFSLLTIAHENTPTFSFFLTDIKQKNDAERFVKLSRADIARINPNTRTLPVLRSAEDAALAKKIYERVPVLIDEGDEAHGNTWGVKFTTIFHMSNDSNLFKAEPRVDYLPLYEGKMIHQYDSRWATFDQLNEDGSRSDDPRNVTETEKADADYEPCPRYYVRRKDVLARIADAPNTLRKAYAAGDEATMASALGVWIYVSKNETPGVNAKKKLAERYGDAFKVISSDFKWATEYAKKEYKECTHLDAGELATLKGAEIGTWTNELMELRSPKWLMGWRDVTNATNERTFISTVIPRYGTNHKILLIRFTKKEYKIKSPLLLGNVSSLIFDYIARLKIGGTSMSYFIFKQLPVLPPSAYTYNDISFIAPRVIELVYTCESLQPWAREMGYDGSPYKFDSSRRALLRAELDAYYAKLYGLTRDELRFILDPSDVMGENYPTETFRTLKNNETRQFDEYRARRLVLEAWDRQNER